MRGLPDAVEYGEFEKQHWADKWRLMPRMTKDIYVIVQLSGTDCKNL